MGKIPSGPKGIMRVIPRFGHYVSVASRVGAVPGVWVCSGLESLCCPFRILCGHSESLPGWTRVSVWVSACSVIQETKYFFKDVNIITHTSCWSIQILFVFSSSHSSPHGLLNYFTPIENTQTCPEVIRTCLLLCSVTSPSCNTFIMSAFWKNTETMKKLMPPHSPLWAYCCSSSLLL